MLFRNLHVYKATDQVLPGHAELCLHRGTTFNRGLQILDNNDEQVRYSSENISQIWLKTLCLMPSLVERNVNIHYQLIINMLVKYCYVRSL